jgi:outer membrane murein-binding lipoprotein Lpp
MVKTIVVIGFLSLVVVSNSYASDSDRIDQLEKQVQELNLRVSKLESSASNPTDAQKFAPSGEGSKSIANWRRLTPGMSAKDVQSILGEPQQLDGGTFATWHYSNGGIVMFNRLGVSQWTEPRK